MQDMMKYITAQLSASKMSLMKTTYLLFNQATLMTPDPCKK